MEPVEILSLICSIIGAIFFIVAIVYEIKIMDKVKKLKAYKKWQLLTFFTAFFFLGYVVNILSLLFGWTDVAAIFGALVYAMGGAFVLLVVYVSFTTYKVIFEAAE
jgi:ABC-type Co2+ transport system permease subunit